MKRSKTINNDRLPTAVEDVMKEITRPVDNSVQVEIVEEFAKFLNLLAENGAEITGLIDNVEESTITGKFYIRKNEYKVWILKNNTRGFRFVIDGGSYSYSAEVAGAKDLWEPNYDQNSRKTIYLKDFLAKAYTSYGYTRPSTIPQVSIKIGKGLS